MTSARLRPLGVRGYAALLSRNPDFRSLWLGSVVSQLGDWFNSVALLGLLVELTQTPASAGLVIVAQILPAAFVGLLISGAVADRFDRKKIMVTADLIRAAIALTFLLIRSPETAWIGFAATAGLGIGAAFFQPASAAALPNLVSKEELPTANALAQSTFASMLFLGALLGGVIAQLFGRDAAFVLNAVSFLISVFFVLRTRANFSAARSREMVAGEGALRILTEGFRYLRENATARAYVLVKPAWSWIFGAVGLYSVFALNVYGVGDIGTSLLYAGRGVGAFISPLIVVGRIGLTDTRLLHRVIRIGLVVSILGYLLFALSKTPLVGVAGTFTAHFGGAMTWTFSRMILQVTTPDHVRGRVLALDDVAQSVVIASANVIAGVVATLISPQAGALVIVALGSIGAAIWIIATWKS